MWEDHQEGMWERLRGQFAIALWDERRHAVASSGATGSASRRFTGRARATGCSSLRRSKACSRPAWCPPGRTCAGSIRFSLSPRCRARSLVSKGCSFCRRPVICESPLAATPRMPPVIEERAYWEMDFPDQGDEERGTDPRELVDEFEAAPAQGGREAAPRGCAGGRLSLGRCRFEHDRGAGVQAERPGDQYLYDPRG